MSHRRNPALTPTEVADLNRKRAAEETVRCKVKFRPPLKHQFTQKELLLDALGTETENQKWLEVQRLQDYERALGRFVGSCCLYLSECT